MYQLKVLQVTRVPGSGPEVTADPAPSTGTGHSLWPKETPGYPQPDCTALPAEPSANLPPCPMGSKLAKGPRCPSSGSLPGTGHTNAKPHHTPHPTKGLGTYHPGWLSQHNWHHE